MDLRQALLEEHSRAQASKIAAYVGADPGRFAELVKLLLGPVYRVSQRAAWPVSLCVERHPELVKPHFGVLVKQLERDEVPAAVRRNVARLLQFVEIPKRYEGRLFDACYKLLDDPAQPIAVRVFTMSVCARIARNEPSLLAEVKMVAEKYPSLMSAGFRSRMRKIFSAP